MDPVHGHEVPWVRRSGASIPKACARWQVAVSRLQASTSDGDNTQMRCVHGNEYMECNICYDDARAASELVEDGSVYTHPDGGVLAPKDVGEYTPYIPGLVAKVDRLIGMFRKEFGEPQEIMWRF